MLEKTHRIYLHDETFKLLAITRDTEAHVTYILQTHEQALKHLWEMIESQSAQQEAHYQALLVSFTGFQKTQKDFYEVWISRWHHTMIQTKQHLEETMQQQYVPYLTSMIVMMEGCISHSVSMISEARRLCLQQSEASRIFRVTLETSLGDLVEHLHNDQRYIHEMFQTLSKTCVDGFADQKRRLSSYQCERARSIDEHMQSLRNDSDRMLDQLSNLIQSFLKEQEQKWKKEASLTTSFLSEQFQGKIMMMTFCFYFLS
jgi:hypothetical protein